MRLTSRLYAQHLGWTFKKHWQIQGKRSPNDTGAASELAKLGIKVKDIKEVLRDNVKRKPVEIYGTASATMAEDETHPHWHNEMCHIYGNANVLLEGIDQAKILTKCLDIKGMPKTLDDSLVKMQLPSSIDRNVHHIILASNTLDAEQVKLPKIKIPERPAYNLPREYGISHNRKMRLLVNRLLMECEKLAPRSTTSCRNLIDNVGFMVNFSKGADLLQFNILSEKMVTAAKPIEPIRGSFDGEIPDLYPMKCTISIPKKNIYTIETCFPLSKRITKSHPHTIFTFFNKELVGNLHGSSVTPQQFQSRTLINAFTVAASRAKQLYGESFQEQIPKPIVVQSIQTDGRTFHFGVFQLNTLALSDDGETKNYWFHEQNIDLFAECGYKSGRPYVEGYNKNVFRYLNAFYINS